MIKRVGNGALKKSTKKGGTVFLKHPFSSDLFWIKGVLFYGKNPFLMTLKT